MGKIMADIASKLVQSFFFQSEAFKFHYNWIRPRIVLTCESITTIFSIISGFISSPTVQTDV